MKKSREEWNRIHKEKCRELKQIRAEIAKDLGIDLKQTECTYQGYCSGTCPKCMGEEWRLNAAILKKQMAEGERKRRAVAAGLTTAAAICLSGCTANGVNNVDGGTSYPPEGDVEYSADLEETGMSENTGMSEEAGTSEATEESGGPAGTMPYTEETQESGTPESGTACLPEGSDADQPREYMTEQKEGDTVYMPYAGELEGDVIYLPYEDDLPERTPTSTEPEEE